MAKIRNVVKQSINNYRKYKKSVLTPNYTPYKPLLVSLSRSAGHNNLGRITVRGKRNSGRRMYRLISFKRVHFDIEGIIKSIEYDPNRSSFISLIEYKLADGKTTYEYVLHTLDTKVGDTIITSQKEVEIKNGNTTQLINIPQNTLVNSVELIPGKGAKFARSAGTAVEVLGHLEDGYTIIKLSSDSHVKVLSKSLATIGTISNQMHNIRVDYKAGQAFHKGRRPITRGTAQNPVDHPHGGGEGRKGTKRHPVSYKAKIARGGKTANRNRPRIKFILKNRKRNNKTIVNHV